MPPERQSRHHGHTARKRFGQHFLSDTYVIDAIVHAIKPRPGEALAEVGPGLDSMTDPVVALSEHLTAVELDRVLVLRLQTRPELTVIAPDVLKVDFGTVADAHPRKLRVIGNLPYNNST